MKNILFMTVAIGAFCAFGQGQYDIRPDEAAATDAPTAVEWQDANDSSIAALTSDSVLATVVKDEKSAVALLEKLRGAYLTDPMAALQIGAVSQWVMIEDERPWYGYVLPIHDTPHADGREIWVKALMTTLKSASDDYVMTFCLDQLRWCGYPKCADCIRAFARTARSIRVREFAEMVAKELEGGAIGF